MEKELTIRCVNCGDQELKAYLPMGPKHGEVKKDYQGYHVACKKCSHIILLVPSKYKDTYDKIVKTIVDDQNKPAKVKKED